MIQIHLVDEAAAQLADDLDRRLIGAAARIRTGCPDHDTPGVLVGAEMPGDERLLRQATGIVLIAPELAEVDRVRQALAGREEAWLDVLPDPAAAVMAERSFELLLRFSRRDGLGGAVVGLVGFRATNWMLARFLSTTGVDIGYWSALDDRRTREECRRYALITGAKERSFDHLLRESDALIIDCPDEPGSQPLIGRAELALMRDDASIVNLTSSTALDDGALIQALRGDYLTGLALARTNLEPLPPDSPLRSIERVLYVPEIARVDERVTRGRLAGQLARTLASRPELHLELRRVRHVARRRPPSSERPTTEPKGRD